MHLLDWHIVAQEAYAADLRDLADELLSVAEIERRYRELLLEVVLVQQQAILRSLVHHHGLQGVFLEGLTKPDVCPC